MAGVDGTGYQPQAFQERRVFDFQATVQAIEVQAISHNLDGWILCPFVGNRRGGRRHFNVHLKHILWGWRNYIFKLNNLVEFWRVYRDTVRPPLRAWRQYTDKRRLRAVKKRVQSLELLMLPQRLELSRMD